MHVSRSLHHGHAHLWQRIRDQCRGQMSSSNASGIPEVKGTKLCAQGLTSLSYTVAHRIGSTAHCKDHCGRAGTPHKSSVPMDRSTETCSHGSARNAGAECNVDRPAPELGRPGCFDIVLSAPSKTKASNA